MKKIQTLKRAWILCAPYHKYFVGILGFLLVQQLFNTVFPIIFGSMVTAVTKSDVKSFIVAISIWAFLMCLRGGTFYLRDRIEIKNLDYDLTRFLSKISMEKFFSISMGQHHVGHSIIKRSVMSKGESSVHGIVSMAVYDFIPTILMILMPLGFLMVKVPLVGICVLVTVVLFSIYTIKYNTKFVPKLRELDTASNVVSKKQGEFIENADVVYVNAQEERVREECDEENASQAFKGKPVWLSYIGWIHSGLLLIWLSQTVAVLLCGYLAYKGKIASGMFVTAYMWVSSSLGTLSNIGRIQRNLAKSLAPLNKYFEFLDYEPDIVMPKKPISISYLKGRIEFMGVSFTYSPRTKGSTLNDDADEGHDGKEASPEIPALKDVSFVLDGGKRYAFVGKSGAGKSTLVGLILRAFDPQEGQILVDGVDLRMLDYRELRRNVGLVPQEVSMFDGTMRYNVTFGMNGLAEKVTEEELNRVAKLSRVSEFFGKLEKGWDTIIGERGIKLSGGQRQRVGIARALIKNPHILIFDEATSSLDTENEAQIRESIREASVGKTTIIIAHRLATVRDADKIFVFDEGKIVGEGSHESLLQTNEYYQRLVHNQVIMA